VQANTVELLALFDRDIRYLVPIFQRNYKWNEHEHWAPLWLDVRNVAEDILDFGEGPDLVDHFLGAIVCEQQDSYGRDAHALSVIDGQQRLTTIQLFLAAAQKVCDQRGYADDASYLSGLLHNRDTVVRGRLEHQYKIWPNVADRAGYLDAMRDGDGHTVPEQAVRFFRQAIDTWLELGDDQDPLDDADNTPAERMQALITAATRYVRVVKIDLERNDNAQLIFETLNGRGERLTDADLIRNFLFRKADEQGANVEALHQSYWQQFDQPRWSARIAHGRHQRERIHLFMNHWLSMRRLEEVPAAALFRSFKDHVARTGEPAETIAKDLFAHSQVFDSFDQQPTDSAEWWFFRRLAEMDLITVYPVLLWLFGQPDQELPPANRRRALRAIESFLVRRLLRRDTTRSYGALFIETLQAAAGGGAVADVDARIIALLASKTADADRWPTDDDMHTAVLHTNVYKLKQSRLKMILEAIERHLAQGGLTETVALGRSLWIEHLLPQGWRMSLAWALPSGIDDPTRAGLERDHLLHTLGNLTLTTDKLDIALSNQPWTAKVRELAQHSSLGLNRAICQQYPDHWDEQTILVRGKALTEHIIALWPGPDRMLNEAIHRA
jgi:hypothetical protein